MANESLSFNNTNEELEHLRSKVLEQERRLEKFGINKDREEVVKNTLNEYKVDQSLNLTKGQDMSAGVNAEAILNTESEKQLQEMVSLTQKKGNGN